MSLLRCGVRPRLGAATTRRRRGVIGEALPACLPANGRQNRPFSAFPELREGNSNATRMQLPRVNVTPVMLIIGASTRSVSCARLSNQYLRLRDADALAALALPQRLGCSRGGPSVPGCTSSVQTGWYACNRVRMSTASVAPGTTGTFYFTVRAPRTAVSAAEEAATSVVESRSVPADGGSLASVSKSRGRDCRTRSTTVVWR